MEAFGCEDAKKVALEILKTPDLVGKVFLEGGLVPWVLTGNDSGRLHGDIDFSVHREDMDAVRSWLKAEGHYDPDLDSVNIPCNTGHEDYGVHAIIGGILVSFGPYWFEGEKMFQRNASHTSFEGYDALFVADTEGLADEDFVEMRTLPDKTRAGIATLESVRAAKETTDREKDMSDLAELAAFEIDPTRYERVKRAFAVMKVNCPAHSE